MTTITLEEYEIMKDSKYRMYVAAIDKALKNFEYTSEWADLISALGKLNKVLQSHAKFPVIPRRIKISKRLAQCMHPALPSGVHLKALETYDIIFRCMGTNRLACELFIYSSGLFPLMSHAAMNIRPTLLTIFETHFVPLGARLRPALSGFLSGILPGLDNGSDHFERTNTLFENVCESVSPLYFYTCIWQCVANNSPVRLPAITYVLAHYNRKLHMEDQLCLMGHDVGLMVCGLCAAVQDSSVLVQRSALDLLILCFPMQNKQLIYTDMVRLVTAALTTILRRDMSLNRRLYSWLLETDSTATAATVAEEHENTLIGPLHLPSSSSSSSSSTQQQQHQQSIAYDLLNDAIRDILKKSCCTIPLDMKPYRLLTSLFEKPQIGPIILDGILYDVFRVLFLSCLNLQKHKNQPMRCVSFNGDLNSLKSEDEKWLSKQFVSKNCQELIKNANLLFNTLQSYYIWSYIERLYEDAVKNIKKFKYRDRNQVNDVGSGVPYILELCLLTDFLLDVIPTETYAETTSNILPNLFNKIISTLNNYITDLNHLEISKSLELATKILGKIQPVTMTQVQQEIQQEEQHQQQQQDKSTEEQRTIEKSKSDSRINENLNIEENELSVDELSLRERSYSNQFLKKKEKSSPKIEKKTKNKKSKSSSKLYDLKSDQEIELKDSNADIQDVVKDQQLSPPTVSVVLPSPPSQAPSATAYRQHQIVSCCENKHFAKCLERYQAFFVCFIEKKILPDVNINDVFTSLIYDREERLKQLRQLLISDNNNCSMTSPSNQLKKNVLICLNIAPDNAESECHRVMNIASNLLLEFCAFPISTNFPNNTTVTIMNSSDLVIVPKWLAALLVSACCRMSSREIQLIAMNTLLEIFSLAKNQDYIRKCQNEKNIIIIGILEIQYVGYIEKNTKAIEEMTKILWSLLGLVKNQKQLMQCITLLYQIHNIFDTNLFVEQIIGNYLSDQNITTTYLKQFFTLWHLGRDLNIKRLPPNEASTRNFDRCLLKILDMLSNKSKPTMQLLSESFLNHCLLHNDITRVLYPILLKLLASNTATVSIRHVNIQDGEVPDGERTNLNAEAQQILEETRAKKVYAVSSVNGNIMYHVTDENKPKSPKKRWFGFASGKSGKKYASAINMTTSLMEDSNNIVTAKNKDFKGYISGNSPKGQTKNNMKVIINPLSSKEIYSDGVEGSYARLDSHSSTESLSSTENAISIDDSIDKKFNDGKSESYSGERDSGYDTLQRNYKKQNDILNALVSSGKNVLLENIEPISDGIKSVKLSKSHSFDEKADLNHDIENSLVQSWSYCISDSTNLHCGLEFSQSAEEFFNVHKNQVNELVGDILNKILDNVCEKVCPAGAQPANYTKRPTDLDLKYKMKKNFVLYPIHAHICLYCEIFDSNQVIYALNTLKVCIQANPKLFIKCSATSGIKNLKSNEILHLLARHRKSYLGLSFNGELSQEHINFYRGYTFLDIIITICLNYGRAFFPFFHDNSSSSASSISSLSLPIVMNELENNIKIHLESFEILNVIIENLIAMVAENNSNKCGGGFISYIADLLIKCKIQKILLPCLLMSVRNFDEEMTFAEDVLLFNNFRLMNNENRIGEHVESFQIQLLRLIHSLIILEYSIFPNAKPSTITVSTTSGSASNNQQATQSSISEPLASETSGSQSANERLNYKPSILIPNQNMFLSAILSALRNKNMRNLHEKWLNMVTCCLPYFRENLKQISLSVIHQICNNIETISNNYKKLELDEFEELGSDYTVTQLESLTILCHYCLLDPSQTVNQQVPASTATSSSTAPTEILNNLVNVFFTPISSELNSTTKQNSDYYQEARKTILSHMPRIISSVAKLWQTVVGIENDFNSIYGNPKMVKQQLLEFLSPIAVHHGASFLAAVAVAWYERRNPLANFKTVLPEPNSGQNNLVYLVSAIRVIPLDNLVQTVTAVIKNPPPCDGLNSDVCLEVSILELFYCYMRNASATQLSEAWTSLLSLVREVTSLNPSAQFLVAAVLHEMMIKCCPLEEKKDQKDLQDVTAKLIDSISQVCASCLEQTTWLRKNFAVREQDEETASDTSSSNVISGGSPDLVFSSSHSVQAQLVLAEILAPILDICFGSSEKDKVNNILASLMCSIVPYLKTHTIRNMPSFVACSKLLSSLSSYQYTRKAWKKEVFDLLLDNTLFQMDHLCLKYWRIIVDNLMTHDNTTFRDLMARVSMTQSGTLGIFSSREQEYEQKAQLLKRLAYVIFCSEIDQYAKYMPEIQEQLTTNLRLNVPGIQAQVFLCFRVILIRMSPLHVTSLWPIIISEMLQVFIQIEQELTTDTEEFSSHIKLMSSLDASWAINSSNGLHALGHPHWLRLQLAAAKLLDLMLLLPATTLPQFQMYRWAFVGDDPVPNYNLDNINYVNQTSFTPHVIRIAELMDRRYIDSRIDILPMKRNELLLTINQLNQLKDLHGFFKTLSSCSDRHRTECSKSYNSNDNFFTDRQLDKQLDIILNKIDKIVEADFLDKIPR